MKTNFVNGEYPERLNNNFLGVKPFGTLNLLSPPVAPRLLVFGTTVIGSLFVFQVVMEVEIERNHHHKACCSEIQSLFLNKHSSSTLA